MSEEPLKKCPKCGKKKLRRVFGGGAAIIFKGSGFYQTDYRSESYKAAAKAEQEATKPEGKPEQEATKPAADKSSTNGKADAGAKEKSGDGKKSTGKTSKSKT